MYERQETVRQVGFAHRLNRHILAVREWCRAHGVKPQVPSGTLSGIVGLAATDATTTMLVNVLVSVGQFQRDLHNEPTRGGLAAAWAQGARSGRLPRLAQLGVVKQVRQAFRDGASIAVLAREHDVSRVSIRTAVADLLPDRPASASSRARIAAPDELLLLLGQQLGVLPGPGSSTAGSASPAAASASSRASRAR
ncbi:hypothetical protein ACIBQ1_59625 [Nonomuraea sp. NPDC050153]|uniref:hypothetical protein n=1 Tax=Nonomuraea sp. NPDC050153 TaxID=3364359 RepID=UPI0037AE281D